MMGDRDDHDRIGLNVIDQRKRESRKPGGTQFAGEDRAGIRMKAKPVDRPLHIVEKTVAEFGRDLVVVKSRPGSSSSAGARKRQAVIGGDREYEQ